MPQPTPTPTLHLFTPSTDKLVIGTVDGHPVEVFAQYNPKELALQAAATWNPTNGNGKKPSGGNQPLSWAGTEPQTMTAELLFDGVEENISVRPLIDTLISSPNRATWAAATSGTGGRRCASPVGRDRQFRCIVQSVQTKITMFDKQGNPCAPSARSR